ncbi:DUF3899 domain-containing protein [Fictibacillus barbaricus]|uniref:DUF3899 domain-containing protein n=1 Tax=Fictibacillus barbaricus TaxID=182136 RepID=A0ABU1TXS7_9BACL|nr:DUF3899 domain-containing protein [Fictibacillus barbaricus]MDR7072009.1 hypothetical protein [Fictibacillus barbaricus]
MKDELKKSLIISGIAILSAAVITLITGNESKSFLEAFITMLFYISLPIAMLGVALYVGKSGFFDFFAYSFKKMTKVLSRNPDYDEQTQFATNFRISERIKGNYMRPFLFSGIILTIFSITVAYTL